jgi:energy-coupling factor transporter ATP-binding protein EcfA2
MAGKLTRGGPEHLQHLQALAGAFRPAAPIDRRELFSGRTEQLGELFNAVAQPGQHAVVYGERGVGKTSLATVATGMLAAGQALVARATCDRSDDFGSVWRKALDGIELTATRPGVGFVAQSKQSVSGGSSLLGGGEVTPHDVVRSLRGLSQQRPLVVFVDEFDRLASDEARVLFADAVKALSDGLVAATVVLIGVADDVDSLVKEHQSVERALVQIHMPRMSTDELAEIVTRGMGAAQLGIGRDAVATIARLSQGLPHYTHLIAQLAGRAALDELRTKVLLRDVQAAVAEAIRKAQQGILDAYDRATFDTRPTLYPQVVLACALAHGDDFGFFTPSDVRAPLRAVAGKEYESRAFARHLDRLADEGRGQVLERRATAGGVRYRFGNPLLQPYVLMRGLAEGAIRPETLT